MYGKHTYLVDMNGRVAHAWTLPGEVGSYAHLLPGGTLLATIHTKDGPEHLAGTQQLMLKYPAMDAADASLVSLAEMSPKAEIVTTDRRHFKPCRGLRNRALKLILPE